MNEPGQPIVRSFVFMVVMLMITTAVLLHNNTAGASGTDAHHGMFICVHASYANDHYRG